MAVLEKLSICGIRSFGPGNQEHVQFSTPLTLFLGQNGCGKTTIIESLKYALTGDLPAGTSGGSGFVNDPKLSNKNSTKGFIKVKFTDIKGEHITVARFMEVSIKAGGKLQFKNLNPSIRWEDSERSVSEDIAGRCADIEMYCAQKLNVSKPVLNSVIFCHQENSSWPLEEPKKLKERFDEIFGSTEYNKCVEKFRKIVKEKKDKIKVLKVEFDARKQAKKYVEVQKEKLGTRKEKLNSINDRVDEKKRQIEPMDKRMTEILELESILGNLQMELKGKEKTHEGLLDQQNTIKGSISYIYEGTDEELNREISTFEEEQGKISKTIKELEQKKNMIEKKIDETNEELQKMQVKLGQLKEEENQYNKKCEERKEHIEKAVVKLNVTNVDSGDLDGTIHTLKTSLKSLEAEFDKLVETKNSEEKQLQDLIDKARENSVKAEGALSSNETAIIECTKKIQELSLKLSYLDDSNTHLQIIVDRIKDFQAAYKKAKDEFDERKKAKEIEELKDKIQRKEQSLENLESEYRILQENHVTEQALDREKAVRNEKQREINMIKVKHAENFRYLFGENVPENNFERCLKEVQDREETKYQSFVKNISEMEKNVATLTTTIKHTKEKLKNCKEELQLNKNKVTELCKDKDFNVVLKESYNNKEKLQKNKGQYRSAKVMYEAFISKFENEKPCCPVCETDFTSKREVVGGIIQNLKRRIQEVPNKLILVEEQLKKEEEHYNKLQQLKPASSTIEVLENVKMPMFENELVETQEKYQEILMELATTKAEMEEPKKLIDICGRVVTDAALLDRYLADVNKGTATIAELEEQLEKVPSNRTREESEAEVDNVKAELSNLRKQHDTSKKLFDNTTSRLQTMYTSMQTEIQRKLESEKSLQATPLITSQRQEQCEKLRSLKIKKKTLSEDLNAFDKQLKKAIADRSSAIEENKIMVHEKSTELSSNKIILDEIQKLQSTINQYELSDARNKLENALEALESTKSKIQKLGSTRDTLISTISDKREGQASQSSKFRALTDNKTLREIQAKATYLEEEIAKLKKQIGNHDYRSIYEEKKRIEKRINEFNSDINLMRGEQKEIEKNIHELESELNKPENKSATIQFLKKYYELHVVELMIEDLCNYTCALEQSILKFHKERMVQINKTIRELWRSIYKGNDIDYIEIQTEDSVGGTGGKRRSYNYKVVQVKKGVELEMRGRCSAGQRVLACLVIRMALSETFSANCGILALDEPTTNLDRENIGSLSDALSKIITAREKQRNFQLLVITHDEDFLHTLTREQSVSHYWRVHRDEEGFSQIKKEIL